MPTLQELSPSLFAQLIPTYSSETRKKSPTYSYKKSTPKAGAQVDFYRSHYSFALIPTHPTGCLASLVEAWLGRPLVGVRRGQ